MLHELCALPCCMCLSLFHLFFACQLNYELKVGQKVAAYHLDRKSSIRLYLRFFFDLMDVAFANAFLVYNVLQTAELTLLDVKVGIETHIIGPYTSRSRAPPKKDWSKRKYRYQQKPDDKPTHLPEFQPICHRCVYCYDEGINHKTFVKCTECGDFLCLLKDRNCFLKTSHSGYLLTFKICNLPVDQISDNLKQPIE